ncbi:MAG: hypothetical protein ACXAC7_24415, partial [Candidatus Hodarchaeales archaeon]
MSEMNLGKYTFIPWIKSGFGALITNNEEELGQPRASIIVKVNVHRYDLNDVKDTILVQSGNREVFGPGDVKGILKNVITRRYPIHNTPNADENKFPLIEFSQGDFPWRYTPAKPNEKSPSLAQLRPWLCLIVLKESEFTWLNKKDLNPQIEILNVQNSLPNLDQIWAWSHCQITEEVKNPVLLKEILNNQPYKAVSRILCPRKLDFGTKYFAFVIPTFEAGRLASIGQSVPDSMSGTTLAWNITDISSLTTGIYDWWSFSTGPQGDFESLAREIKPDTLNESVGIRDLDLSNHSLMPNIPPLLKPISLGGALWSPAAFDNRKQINPTDYTITNPSANSPSSDEIKALITNLKEYLDLNEKYQWSIHNPGDDPIISLPKYGKWHSGNKLITKITDNPEDYQWLYDLSLNADKLNFLELNPPYPWFEQLNLDPANRVAGGLGTVVIQKLQEELMSIAWDQAGDIIKANNALKFSQLARTVSTNI